MVKTKILLSDCRLRLSANQIPFQIVVIDFILCRYHHHHQATHPPPRPFIIHPPTIPLHSSQLTPILPKIPLAKPNPQPTPIVRNLNPAKPYSNPSGPSNVLFPRNQNPNPKNPQKISPNSQFLIQYENPKTQSHLIENPYKLKNPISLTLISTHSPKSNSKTPNQPKT